MKRSGCWRTPICLNTCATKTTKTWDIWWASKLPQAGDIMIRRIMVVLSGLIACAGLARQVAGQQTPPAGAQAGGGGGRGRGAAPPTPPSLFFKETWRLMGAPHAIAPGEVVVTNANLELKMYGPSATAADTDKRIWISGPPMN